jgi:hypothetical protein
MIRAGFPADAVFDGGEAALLEPLLQGRFVIGAAQTLGFTGEGRVEQRAAQKCGRCSKTGVEVNRPDDGFKGVGKQALLFASAGFFLACTEAQMIAQLEPLRCGVKQRRADDLRQCFRKLPCIPIGKGLAKVFAGDQPENAIAQKFEPLVIEAVGALPVGAMGEGNPGLFYFNSSGGNSISAYNPDTGTPVNVNVGINPTGLAVNPQSGALLTSNFAGKSVSIVDTLSNPLKTVQTLGLPGSPQFGVAIDTFTNLAVIVDQANNRVFLFPMPN